MSGVVGQVAFFVVILVVILIHEAAHFAVAKGFGIKVEEFFVGFGPRLWSTRRGETEYGVKALPFGGYVRIAGMNPFQEPAARDRPRTFGAKPIWQRALVIVAGPATHFVLAFLFFALWLGVVGRPTTVEPVVQRVEPTLQVEATHRSVTSPAVVAGLRPGDRIVGVDGISAPTEDELIRYTQTHVGKPITLRVERDGRVSTVGLKPVESTVAGQKVGRIGVVLSLARDRAGVIGSVTGGVKLVGSYTAVVVRSLGRLFGPEGIGRVYQLLFGGAQRQPGDATSVIGAGRIAGQAAASGNFGDVLLLFATLNVFIGILNLLPLLPFDGGHLAVLAIEKIRGRPVDARKLIPVTAVVATLLILFMVSLVYLDITKPVPDLFR
ncbi:MAG: M50 family metallopeptidase [Actinomycetota bacterium]|nr:M50 family metallopeptidase [Actinomycetota bacterium]